MKIPAVDSDEFDRLLKQAEDVFVEAILAVFRETTAHIVNSYKALTAAGAGDFLSADDTLIARQVWAGAIPGVGEEVVAAFGAGARGVAATIIGAPSSTVLPFSYSDPLYDMAARDYLASVRSRLVGIGDTMWVSMRDELLTGFKAGESIDQLSARLRSTADIAERRARTIARTEIVGASNAGSLAGIQALPDELQPKTKTWLSTHDRRTRDTHVQADGQTVPINGWFTVGAGTLAHPGDWRGPAEEVINCRCTMLYDVPGAAAPPTEVSEVPLPGVDIGDAQWDVLKPRPLDLNKRKARLKALETTPDGKLLSETLSSFQRGSNSITRLRTDVAARLAGKEVPERTGKRIDALLGAIRSNPHRPPKLYRGMKLEGLSADDVLAKYRPGETIDMNISSFTSDRKRGIDFSQAPAGASRRKFDGASVIMELDEGATGLPIQNISPNLLFYSEKEWLSGGRFRITGVRESQGRVHISIVQEEVL